MIEFTGVLLHMDGQPDSSGEIFMPTTKVELPDKDVLVTAGFSNDFRDVVGTAKITKEGDTLRYAIKITQEQVPPAIWKQLKPCLGGRIKQRLDSIIGEFSATSIGLSGMNADPRIKNLGEE